MAGLLSFARRQLSLRCAFEVVNVRKFGYWANLLRHTSFSVGSNPQRTPTTPRAAAALGPRLARNLAEYQILGYGCGSALEPLPSRPATVCAARAVRPGGRSRAGCRNIP